MKGSLLVVVACSMGLPGCRQPAEQSSSNSAALNSSEPQNKHAYCFFSDDEMKGWTATRDSDGNIRVTGKTHVKDPRYKAVIAKWSVGPHKLIVYPTIGQNDTGYAQADNWWDVSVEVPNTGSLSEAQVQCGDKLVADLKVTSKG